MIIINKLLEKARSDGYEGVYANTKVAQDIILLILSKTEYNKNITLKGGVLMRSITNDIRRATQDLDIDLIRYSLEDVAIKKIIDKMNGIEDIKVTIIGSIKELNHQDYKGREVHLELRDNENTVINAKLDIGVQADMTIDQEEYCFDVGFNDNGIMILANTKEQMFAEKLGSLLRWDIASTRYKDIYDMYFLKDYVNIETLEVIIDKIIFKNDNLHIKRMEDIGNHLINIFNNDIYFTRLKNSKHNWIEVDTKKVTESIIEFIKNC